MSIIQIRDIDRDNVDTSSNGISYMHDLNHADMDSINGGVFWLALIGAAWLGYEIGKEAKTNWFKR